MRQGLAGLTLRGRAFVAAGATALGCAIVLGYDDLVRVGALLLLVPLAAAFFLGRSRYRLGLVRSLHAAQVTAGQQAQVQLDLSNDGRMPTGVLLLEDRVPYALGSPPRFLVDRMGARWARTVRYPVSSEVRGRFEVGPMQVTLSDPFGLVRLERTFQSRSSLVVTPRVVTLPAVPLSGVWTGSGDNRPRAYASGNAEDVTVREYRRGDDLRRVHWRSSAHAGELMVRREEQPWQSRATLLVDNRRFAHRGLGAESSLEHAVGAAASVAAHLVQRGFRVRLVCADGPVPGSAPGAGSPSGWEDQAPSTGTAGLLESLAVLAETEQPHLDTRWLAEGGHAGLLVAVLGDLDDQDTAALGRLRHSATGAMALVLDVPAWERGARASLRPSSGEAPGDATARQTRYLGAHGWRAVAAGPDEPLPSLWQELAGVRRTTSEPDPAVLPGGAR